MWELDHKEGWVLKIDSLELWYWRRQLRVPCTARRSNQSILKEISPEYSLEGLMLKLKLQYCGHLIRKANLLEKTLYWERLKSRGEGWDKGWDGWMASPTVDMSLSKFQEIVGEGNGTPLQYSCLENPTERGAWCAAVHGVAKSQTWMSDFPFTFYFHALEKEMATHSSVLTWRIPEMGEPGGLLSMGSHRVGHDWSNLAAAAAAE